MAETGFGTRVKTPQNPSLTQAHTPCDPVRLHLPAQRQPCVRGEGAIRAQKSQHAIAQLPGAICFLRSALEQRKPPLAS